MGRLGNGGLFLGLAGRRVRYQVAAHAGSRAVVEVQIAVLHLLGDIADALSEPLPVLEEEKDRQFDTQEVRLLSRYRVGTRSFFEPAVLSLPSTAIDY